MHEGGTRGFYFLPPMVSQPSFNGTFDADIATLNPQIAICDVTNDVNCGVSSATLIVFTTTSAPAITVDPTTPQYQVNWNTQAAGFVAGHTYRVHVTAVVSGSRRELGFADVLLTTTPGQATRVETGDIIVLQDGRTLPIHVRIETGIACDCWVTKAPMPTALYGMGTATINGVLYVVGGVNDRNEVLGMVEAYDPVTDAWSPRASLPTPRFDLGATAINGVLYAVGGYTYGYPPRTTVEAYDPTTDTWTTKASMPTGRGLLGVTAINGILYAVGGDGGPRETVEAYDPTTNSWTTKASMPTGREGLGVTAINGILYAVGGDQTGLDELATVEAYDPSTNTWTAKASMPTKREGLGVTAINGILYAVGGDQNASGGTVLATVEAYDPTTNTWATRASMPTARWGLGVAPVNGMLFAVGGVNGGVRATVEAYSP